MGCFSWERADRTTKQKNIAIGDACKLLIPAEFGGGYFKEESYDGYGMFGGVDVYDEVTKWNRNYINTENFSSKALHEPKLEDFRGLYDFEKEDFRSQGLSEDEICEKDLETKKKFFDSSMNLYKSDIERLKDYCSGASDDEMKEKYGKEYLRNIGIDIACYDEDQEKLKYPIKIVSLGYKGTYEDCEDYSRSDEEQGFSKTYWNR